MQSVGVGDSQVGGGEGRVAAARLRAHPVF